MNSHKNARHSVEGHKLLIERIAVMGLIAAANAAGVYPRIACQCRKRFTMFGSEGLIDRTSRPVRTRTTVDIALAQRIERPMRRIAQVVGRSVASISRVLAQLSLSSLNSLDTTEPVVRCEHKAPGDLRHMAMKNLGRIVVPGNRVTGNPRDHTRGAVREVAHVAIDDHSRVGFAQVHPDEQKPSVVAFLEAAVAHYKALGVNIKRLITDCRLTQEGLIGREGGRLPRPSFGRSCHCAHVANSAASPALTGEIPLNPMNSKFRRPWIICSQIFQ